jgi:hypothetical protein
MKEYKEPELSILVLDFLKEEETRICLESIKHHVKFPVKVIYLHNGPAEYPHKFFQEGLVDQFIQTKVNNGLGIGTRDLFAASFSKFSFLLQNDQFIGRDFAEEEFIKISKYIDGSYNENIIKSVSLAGDNCQGQYSERGHIIKTDFYKYMETNNFLSYFGAGPFHQGPWREELIQKTYKHNNLIHYIWPNQLVVDNGKRAKRQNPDGSIWEHRPDTKQLRLISGPIRERYIYPCFTDQEWETVLETQKWEDWKIPEKEVVSSFRVWH